MWSWTRRRCASHQLLLEPATLLYSSSSLPPLAPRKNEPDPSHCCPFQSERMMLVSNHGASAVRRCGQSHQQKGEPGRKTTGTTQPSSPGGVVAMGAPSQGGALSFHASIPCPPSPSLLSPLHFSGARRQGEPDAGRGASPLCYQKGRPTRWSPRTKRCGTQTSPSSRSVRGEARRPAGRRTLAQ